MIAIEPSDTMTAQRPDTRVPAIRGSADSLPLRDKSVDAAMAVLTVHHWDEGQRRGVRELCRVARDRVVILAFDPEVVADMWLVRDYMPEVAELDRRTAPSLETLTGWLQGEITVEPVPVSRQTPDWTLASFWAHPERVLDPAARNGTSGFARLGAEVVERVTAAVAADLRSGVWDARYGRDPTQPGRLYNPGARRPQKSNKSGNGSPYEGFQKASTAGRLGCQARWPPRLAHNDGRSEDGR